MGLRIRSYVNERHACLRACLCTSQRYLKSLQQTRRRARVKDYQINLVNINLVFGAIQVCQRGGGQLPHLDQYAVVGERRVRMRARHQPRLGVRVQGYENLK